MSERLNQQLQATAAAEAQVEQDSKELLKMRSESRERRRQELVLAVAAYLSREYPRLANDANPGVVAGHLVDRNLSATPTNIEAAIQELGSDLSQKEMSDQEWRDYLEARILASVASPEEREREHERFHARLAASRDEMDHGQRKSGPYLVTTLSMAQHWVNLQEGARLRSLSHEELKREVRGKATPYTYEPLPSTFTPYQISAMSGKEWHEAIRRWGVDQLNQRISEQQAAGQWAHIPVVGS